MEDPIYSELSVYAYATVCVSYVFDITIWGWKTIQQFRFEKPELLDPGSEPWNPAVQVFKT